MRRLLCRTAVSCPFNHTNDILRGVSEGAKQSPLLHVMRLLEVRSNLINEKIASSLYGAPRNDINGEGFPKRHS